MNPISLNDLSDLSLYGGRPILDSHVHFIDRTQLEYNVVEFQTSPALAKDWSIEMYTSECRKAKIPVNELIFIEVASKKHCRLEEVQWVIQNHDVVHHMMRTEGEEDEKEHNNAVTYPTIVGIVAGIEVEEGKEKTELYLSKLETLLDSITQQYCAPTLVNHFEEHSGRRLQFHLRDIVKGFRRLAQDEAAGFLQLEQLVEGMMGVVENQKNNDTGKVFDICIRSGKCSQQFEDAIALAKMFPGIKFVLDHMGKPNIEQGVTVPWKSQIQSIAELPNVYCKISGVLTEAGAKKDETHLSTYINHVIDSFGFQRCMFGSDWFVLTLNGTLKEWITILLSVLEMRKATQEERRFLFSKTARVVYNVSSS